MKRNSLLIPVLLGILVVTLVGCAPTTITSTIIENQPTQQTTEPPQTVIDTATSKKTKTSIVTSTNTLTQQPLTDSQTILTWGELAIRGYKPFFRDCNDTCHSGEGDIGGASIIGTNLKTFKTAQGLFNYIDGHITSGGYSSSSVDLCSKILAFMLTESGLVKPETIFNIDELVDVVLE